MKQNIYDLLNQVETDLSAYETAMPDGFAEKESKVEKIKAKEIEENKKRIQNKLHKREGQKMPLSKKVLKAAAVFIIAILSAGGVAYAATDGEVFHELFTFMSGGSIYEKTVYGSEGEESAGVTITGTAMPEGEDSGYPLLFEEGRLYFTGDGGKTDVTDKISDTEPYFIDVLDEMGNIHRFNIGGRAEEASYGYMEMIIDKNGEYRGGSGSYGHNVKVEEGEYEPEWERKGWEKTLEECGSYKNNDVRN